jgi:hypothetical protein
MSGRPLRRTGGRGPRFLLALLLAVCLPLTSLPFASAPAAGVEGWNYAADRERLLPELPDEPIAAAMQQKGDRRCPSATS